MFDDKSDTRSSDAMAASSGEEISTPLGAAFADRLRQLEHDATNPANVDELSDLLMRLAEAEARHDDPLRAIATTLRAIQARRGKLERTGALADRARLCAALLSLASLRISIGDDAAAREALLLAEEQAACALDPDDAWRARIVALYRLKAALMQRAGDHAAAADALNRAIAHLPDHAGHVEGGNVAATRVQLLAQMAQARLAMGDTRSAKHALRRCSSLLKFVRERLRDGEAAVLWSSVLHLRGVAACADGRFAEADRRYGEALAVLDAAKIANPHLRALIAADRQALPRNRRHGAGTRLYERAPMPAAAGAGAHHAGCCGVNGGQGFECSCAR